MRTDGTDIVVEPYAESRVDELTQPYVRTSSWQEHHAFRNAILGALRPFGTIGALAEAPITSAEEGPDHEQWPAGDMEPAFWIVEAWWGPYQRDVVVETEPRNISAPCLRALAATVRGFPYRCISVNVGARGGGDTGQRAGHLVVAAGTILVGGSLFDACQDISDVVRACETPPIRA